MPTTLRAPARIPLLQVAKTAVAMILAWLIAGTFLPTQLPIFAAIAALLVVQPSVNQSIGRAIERSIGVIVGVAIAYAVGLFFGTTSWIVLLAVVVAIFLSWALKLTPGTANQVPITAMLVLAIGAASPGYALVRIVETMIGAIIGIIVNIAIVPPVLIGPARTSVNGLGNETAATLDRLAVALRAPQSQAKLDELLITARLLRPMQAKSEAALDQAHESLTLNPRQSRHRRDLDDVDAFFRRLGPVITRTLGMTRAFHDRYDDSISREPTVQAIAEELSRASHDLRLLSRDPTAEASEPETKTAGVPVLTAQLSVAAPHSRHWVLIGSLVEDLRRIHDEITGEDAP